MIFIDIHQYKKVVNCFINVLFSFFYMIWNQCLSIYFKIQENLEVLYSFGLHVTCILYILPLLYWSQLILAENGSMYNLINYLFIDLFN